MAVCAHGSRLTALLLLLAFSMFARAGHYGVQYSGGVDRVSGDVPPCTGPNIADGWTANGWGAIVDSGSCNAYPGWGTATCDGEIVATLTWQRDFPSDDPPQAVATKEDAYASWTGAGGACANGLGHPSFPPGGLGVYSQSSSGTKWDLLTNPGETIVLKCTPTANAVLHSAPPYLPYATASVSYQVHVYPLTIEFPSATYWVGWKRQMIGEPVPAVLTCSAIPASTNNSIVWAVSGGSPFNWRPHGENYPGGDEYDWCHYNYSWEDPNPDPNYLSSTGFYFGKPMTDATVACQAYFGYLGKSATVTAKITSQSPVHYWNTDIGDPIMDTLDEQNCKIKLWGGQVQYQDGHFSDVWGIWYGGYVLTPQAMQTHGPGVWYFDQLVAPGRTRTSSGILLHLYEYQAPNWIPIEGVWGLDTSHPYSLWFPANGLEYYDADSPGMKVGPAPTVTARTINEPFATYLMYTSGKPGSVGAPLRLQRWKWESAVSWTGNS